MLVKVRYKKLLEREYQQLKNKRNNIIGMMILVKQQIILQFLYLDRKLNPKKLKMNNLQLKTKCPTNRLKSKEKNNKKTHHLRKNLKNSKLNHNKTTFQQGSERECNQLQIHISLLNRNRNKLHCNKFCPKIRKRRNMSMILFRIQTKTRFNQKL